jgi:hypothetical protein
MRKVAMANTKGLHARKSSGKIPGRVLLLIALGGILLFAFCVFYVVYVAIPLEFDRYHEADVRRCQEELEKQIAEVRSGRTRSLYFYCSVGMDGLLERLINVPAIEEVSLHLTDVTDDGMKSLAAFKNLKSLTVYGGRPSVGDQGFSYIKTIISLEKLELINTKVTDRSLPGLKELPNLRSLTLFHEKRLGPTFTDAGLIHLKALPKLKQLNVSGGWVSDAAVKELQKALPNCKISTKEDDLDI